MERTNSALIKASEQSLWATKVPLNEEDGIFPPSLETRDHVLKWFEASFPEDFKSEIFIAHGPEASLDMVLKLDSKIPDKAKELELVVNIKPSGHCDFFGIDHSNPRNQIKGTFHVFKPQVWLCHWLITMEKDAEEYNEMV